MKVKFTTTLDIELLEKIKIQAVKEKTDVNKMIERLFKEYLKGMHKDK